MLDRVLRIDFVRRAARSLADWVDLQWSYIIDDLKAVAPRARGDLLDVGCGDKPYEEIFLPYVTKYVGVEHEGTFSETAASTRTRGPDVYYDGKRLPFPDESFDTVLSVQVLEHTPDPALLMSEMGRVLKRGGLLIVIVPFSFRLHEEPHDYFRYSPHGLTTLTERAGLSVVEIRAHGSLWSVVGHKINSFLAFRVAHLDGLGQSLGKMSHEGERTSRLRTWSLPVVAPTMAAVTAGARGLDRVLPEPTEALSFRLIATKK